MFDLSFTALVGAERKWWACVDSGDYDADCALGREYAKEFLARLALEAMPFKLAWMVREMTPASESIQIGFFAVLAEALQLAGRDPLPLDLPVLDVVGDDGGGAH